MQETPSQAEPTAGGIEFAPWPTPVENDELWLASLRYGEPSTVSFPSEGFSLELLENGPMHAGGLEATFLSREKRAAVTFRFDNVSAFRVLDEHGLLDIWNASAKAPRPASSTFKVKGHKWQEESDLSWIMIGAEFSFMIATGFDCLEVVAAAEPVVQLRPALVHEHGRH